MLQYLRLFKSLHANFHDVNIVKVPRSQNSHIDSLATLASSSGDHIPRMIVVKLLEHPSTERQTLVVAVLELGPTWMDLYVSFLYDGSLSREAKEAEKVRRMSACLWLSKEKRLYQRSYGGPYLLCLHLRKITKL